MFYHCGFLSLESAFGTGAGSISWICGYNLFTDSCSLIFYYASQFREAPLSKLLIFLTVLDAGQIFQSYCVIWFRYYPVGNLMIHVPLKPSLSTRKLDLLQSDAEQKVTWDTFPADPDMLLCLVWSYCSRVPQSRNL